MTSYARFFTGLLLITASILLILNQEEATYHLVEYDFFGWQFARLLVFFLPGIQLIIAVFLLFRMKLFKYARWLYTGLLIVHFLDAIVYIDHLGSGYEYNPHLLIDPISGFGLILTPLLMILDLYLHVRPMKHTYRTVAWYVYFLFIPLLGAGILKSKIYITDFRGAETPVSAQFNTQDLKELIHIHEDEFATIFFDATCEECLQTATQLAVMNRVDKISTHAVFYSDSASVLKFLQESNLSIPWHIVPYPDFSLFAQYAVPNAYLIKNNKLKTHRTGYFINYNFFDMIRD